MKVFLRRKSAALSQHRRTQDSWTPSKPGQFHYSVEGQIFTGRKGWTTVILPVGEIEIPATRCFLACTRVQLVQFSILRMSGYCLREHIYIEFVLFRLEKLLVLHIWKSGCLVIDASQKASRTPHTKQSDPRSVCSLPRIRTPLISTRR